MSILVFVALVYLQCSNYTLGFGGKVEREVCVCVCWGGFDDYTWIVENDYLKGTVYTQLMTESSYVLYLKNTKKIYSINHSSH